ncbi:MAG: hypothetical protein R2939_22710, partial [Kofleriaceae bacterium]
PPAPQGYPPAQGAAPQPGYPPGPQGYPPAQGAPPQAHPGYPGAQPNYPAAEFGVAPQAQMPGPLDDIARALPSSKPGTILGFPVARLSDPAFQKKVLFIAGIAIFVSIFIPLFSMPTGRNSSKLFFGWTSLDVGPISIGPSKFRFLVWPFLAAAAYLGIAAAPAHIKAKIPPMVQQWLPFTVAYLGVFLTYMGMSVMGALMAMNPRAGGLPASYTMATLAYPLLTFGLIARIARPSDQVARIIIAIGGGLLLYPLIWQIGNIGDGEGLMILINILNALVLLLAVACIVYVVPPAKLPPALRAVDAVAPLVTAVLLVWLPVRVVLMGIALMIEASASMGLFMIIHGLVPTVAYFGVLMMTAPAAYEEAMKLFTKGSAGYPPASGGPPPGGGYPPPGGGYLPQGGGYPPQGGGYPPAGGGYPPAGGGYPPQ